MSADAASTPDDEIILDEAFIRGAAFHEQSAQQRIDRAARISTAHQERQMWRAPTAEAAARPVWDASRRHAVSRHSRLGRSLLISAGLTGALIIVFAVLGH